jgi:hypothetical protein
MVKQQQQQQQQQQQAEHVSRRGIPALLQWPSRLQAGHSPWKMQQQQQQRRRLQQQ